VDVMQKPESRRARVNDRRGAIMRAVLSDGSMRIEDLAQQFNISLMTAHRDLDELESRGILRKTRGVAVASSTSLVESTYAYREGRQRAEKEALVRECMNYIEPGQAIVLDDSTTVRYIAQFLHSRTPLTVVTNALPLMNELRDVRDLTLIALGGTYYHWCSAFMGLPTIQGMSRLRTDTAIMSTAAIVDDQCFHQEQETVDLKRAMFDSTARRILLADHTKFEKRALYGLFQLSDFDMVIVDHATPEEHVSRLRAKGVNVVIAGPVASSQRIS